MQIMNRLRPRLLLCLLLVTGLVQAQSFDGKKAYQIATAGGLVLDNHESIQGETGIFLGNPEKDNTGQVWQLRPVGKDVYQLVNGYSFQALDNGGGNKEQPVIQWPEEKENKNQFWQIKRFPDGTYTFTCVATEMALGVIGKGGFGDSVWHKTNRSK